MKKHYPSRAEDKFRHALTKPLTRRMTYEAIELMRADLFEFLDLLTTNFWDTSEGRTANAAEIQRVADRLKELTQFWDRAARKAMKAGRIDYSYRIDPDSHDPSPCCGPFSVPGWEKLHRQWENTH